jgi:hydroxymethylpyrimidine pyrophosphatase-like HAD family hydrolase
MLKNLPAGAAVYHHARHFSIINRKQHMTSRVIALDLDGTLLTSNKTILPASLEALARAREAGFQVIVVTGRHHVAIHPFYQALALDTPAICCNGTYLYDYQAKKVLQSDPMPVDKALSLTDMLAEHDIHGLMYVDDAMLYERPTGHVIRTTRWAQSLPVEQRPVFTQVDSLAQAARDVKSVWKFALTDEDIPKLQRLPLMWADAGSGVRMVVARSGGYRPRGQQQRQTPGAVGGSTGPVDAGCGGLWR